MIIFPLSLLPSSLPNPPLPHILSHILSLSLSLSLSLALSCCVCIMVEKLDPVSWFWFQPVLHDWCNKGRGMCYPVCGMVHIKEPLLLIGSRPRVSSRAISRECFLSRYQSRIFPISSKGSFICTIPLTV